MADHPEDHKEGNTHSPSPAKAKKMLDHGSVHGKALSGKQKRFLRHVEGGKS